MKKPPFSSRSAILTLLGLGVAVSCSVNKADFTFDDDAYDNLVNGGDGDGDGDMGGASSGGSLGLGGSGAEPSFEPGDTRCTLKQVEFYVGNDLWAPLGAECEFVCLGGECTGSCDPDDTECVSNSEVRACDETGSWIDSTCQFACIEADDDCGGECVPGERQCDGTQKQVCNELGAWEDDGAPCPGMCTEPEAGSAICTGACSPSGARQCINNRAYQECVGAEWVDQGNCDFACVGDDCGGTCVPGTSTCQGNSRVACSAVGQPLTPVPCSGQTCVVNGSTATCTGVCEPGQLTCSEGNIYECTEGAWSLATDCTKLGEEMGLDLSCRSYGPVGKREYLCGECPLGDGEVEVNRCHTAESHATMYETCRLDEERKISLWTKGEECSYCFQGQCVEPEQTCKDNTNARGCTSVTSAWACSPQGEVLEAECKGDGLGNPTYCEIGSCASMPKPPQHDF